MDFSTKKTAWRATSLAAGAIAGLAAHALVRIAWRGFADDDPPLNPDAAETAWSDAVAWTVAAGAAAGVARLAARRGAAEVWRQVLDIEPPVFVRSG